MIVRLAMVSWIDIKSKGNKREIKLESKNSDQSVDKGLISTTYRELLKWHKKNMNRWVKDLDRHFFKVDRREDAHYH